MNKLSAAATLAALFTIGGFAQTPAAIRVEGAEAHGTLGAFEASVLAGLDSKVDAQKNTLAALRTQYKEDYPDVQTAKLNLAILQAQRDKLARMNADIANMRIAALLDPATMNRANSANRATEPAPHEALFDFSKSQTITGTISVLTLVSPYSVVTVDVAGVPTNVFLASTNALAKGGWSTGMVKRGDPITVKGAPARGGANILQALDFVQCSRRSSRGLPWNCRARPSWLTKNARNNLHRLGGTGVKP